jgi:4-aminobutyrate aminotransferase-like enzyme
MKDIKRHMAYLPFKHPDAIRWRAKVADLMQQDSDAAIHEIYKRSLSASLSREHSLRGEPVVFKKAKDGTYYDADGNKFNITRE